MESKEKIKEKLEEFRYSNEYTFKCAARFGRVAWRIGNLRNLYGLLHLHPSGSEFYTRCCLFLNSMHLYYNISTLKHRTGREFSVKIFYKSLKRKVLGK